MVENQRIFMGNTPFDLKLEKAMIAEAAQRREAEQQLRTALGSAAATAKSAAVTANSAAAAAKSAADAVKHLTGWHDGQTESFEVLATQILKEHMRKPEADGGLGYSDFDIAELERNELHVLGKEPWHPMYSEEDVVGKNKKKIRGFEWDGMLTGCKPGAPGTPSIMTMFLIEAKTNVDKTHVTNPDPTKDDGIVERMRRTETYLSRCAAGNFANAAVQVRKQAANWLFEGQKPAKVVGVLVARRHTRRAEHGVGLWSLLCARERPGV